MFYLTIICAAISFALVLGVCLGYIIRVSRTKAMDEPEHTSDGKSDLALAIILCRMEVDLRENYDDIHTGLFLESYCDEFDAARNKVFDANE